MRTRCLGVLFALALLSAIVLPSAAVCTPDPGSAIANGAFDGSSCWNLFDPQQLVSQTYWNHNFYAEINAGADYAAVQLIQLVPVQQGKVYQLSFLTWGTPADSLITMSLQRDTSPWESYGLWQDIRLPAGSNRYVYRFTCTETDPQARFTIFLGRIHGSVSISSLRLEDIDCNQNDFLVNPNFDCDPAYPVGWNWLANSPTTTFATAPGADFGTYCVKMGNLPGGQFYDAYMDQQFLHWTANRFYLLRFWAKGTDTTNQIIAKMRNDATGTQPVWIGYTLTQDWQAYPFLFRPAETTDTAHLTIFDGSLTGDAYFDGMQFLEVPMPDLNSGAIKFYKDVNGDGLADCIYCEMRDRWYTWVAISYGDHFGPFQLWSGPCAPSTAQPVMGNFNGMDADSLNRADIAWVDQASGLVITRLSDGHEFYDPGTNPWYQGTLPRVGAVRAGCFRGNGRDDIATFTLDSNKDVYVLTSTGASFNAPVKWHDGFGLAGEWVETGDFNGDGKADIITFLRANSGNIWVSLSNGSSFQPSSQWAGLFCIHSAIPGVGDIDHDGKCDVFAFIHDATDRRVLYRRSSGHDFPSPDHLAHGYFASNTDDPAVADVNGDGLADGVMMSQLDYKVSATQSWGSNFGDVLTWWNMTLPDIPPPDDPNPPSSSVNELGSPAAPLLLWNSPNPFKGATTITYTLAAPALVNLGVYDVSGRRVATLTSGPTRAGEHRIVWDASAAAPGVYFCRGSAGAARFAHKLIVLR